MPGRASQTTRGAEELGPTAPSESGSVCGPRTLRFHRLLPCVTPKVVNQCKRRGQLAWPCAFTRPSRGGPGESSRTGTVAAPVHTRPTWACRLCRGRRVALVSGVTATRFHRGKYLCVLFRKKNLGTVAISLP